VSVPTEAVILITGEVANEVARAMAKFPPFNSGHEGKAVIEEEVEELWELIKENRSTSRDARDEAIQIAAMAIRYVHDISDRGA
jgi:hydrogenase maturation factor